MELVDTSDLKSDSILEYRFKSGNEYNFTSNNNINLFQHCVLISFVYNQNDGIGRHARFRF